MLKASEQFPTDPGKKLSNFVHRRSSDRINGLGGIIIVVGRDIKDSISQSQVFEPHARPTLSQF